MTVRVCLTFDVDAQFLWIGTFGTRAPGALSRGEYEPRVGLPRVLDLLGREAIRATFFVPGRVAETYPEVVRDLVARGHEVGAHGYLHERWLDLTEAAEAQVLQRSREILEHCTGAPVIGFRAPGFELNPWSLRLLLAAGFTYDSSLMADDFRPYRLRFEDHVPDEGAIRFGEASPLVEFPVSWELDDFPYFAFTGRGQGLRSPAEVGAAWLDEFRFAASLPDSVFTLTMHPQVIGRGPRLHMLTELIRQMKAADARFSTLAVALRSTASNPA